MMTPEELRRRIIETCSKRGGHLAPSLGAVEIALALAETFDPFVDRIVWDVGHQAYAWKLLTGREDRFDTLRSLDGIGGFPNPLESKADAAVAGHAGVALSVAEGYATARDRRGTKEHVVAVVGDSSLVNGTSFEALNCAALAGKVILVINDNGMSISKPAGSFSRFLGRLIAGSRYNRVKSSVRRAGYAVGLSFAHAFFHRVKARIKSFFLKDSFFREFGFRYLGPVDGHSVEALKAALEVAKSEDRSVVIHVVTQKGRGFAPAEANPTAWHGVGPFDLAAVNHQSPATKHQALSTKHLSWSAAFGAALSELAEKDERIVALTAGMKDGTGLAGFAEKFPKRFFDVGIAEGHMTSFAAGLAQGGMRPFVAVYSTFLQRAIDHVMHDVAIARVPVVFCVDRAGVVGADGVTHQGLYDFAMLRTIPNLVIAEPKDEADLKSLLAEALARLGPTVIRYPRGSVPEARITMDDGRSAINVGRSTIWCTGDWYPKACEIAKRVPGTTVVHARYLKPVDAELLARQRAAGMKIVSLENGALAGGLGEAIGADIRFGWPDEFIPHGSPAELESRYGLDVDSIVAALGGGKENA